MTRQAQTPWLCSAAVDIPLILLPPFLATLIAAVVAHLHPDLGHIPPWAWLVLVVGIDVAHVYSTLFRTYLAPGAVAKRRLVYWLVPALGWSVSLALCAWDVLYFWRGLAYLAVFHFIRQQYGFLRLYSRQETASTCLSRGLDQAVIYAATLYPLAYWHTHLPRRFSWFVDGDFLAPPAAWLPVLATTASLAGYAYLALLGVYAVKELLPVWRRQPFRWAKNLLVAGTALSWYVGIVALNQDIVFTVTNIVSHGLPYMALVWLVQRGEYRRQAALRPAPLLLRLFRPRLIPLYMAALVLFAYIEEGLWDGFVWREHPSLFGDFTALPLLGVTWLVWLTPTLALPQITHYLLDGFIWRVHGPSSTWFDASLKKLRER